jgi:hypothetical protein
LPGVVKGGLPVAAFSDTPAEAPPIEVARSRDVGGGNLDVTDLSFLLWHGAEWYFNTL